MGGDFSFGIMFAAIMVVFAAIVLVVVLTAGEARKDVNGYYDSTSLVVGDSTSLEVWHETN